MLFGGFPLTCRCRGDTRDRLREAEERPKQHRSSTDQLANKRVKLSSLRLLEDDKSLNHRSEHPPRTCGVQLATKRQQRALFIKDSECASVIA
jgi:hypothetical protein